MMGMEKTVAEEEVLLVMKVVLMAAVHYGLRGLQNGVLLSLFEVYHIRGPRNVDEVFRLD